MKGNNGKTVPMNVSETIIRIILLSLLLYSAFSFSAARHRLNECEQLEIELRTELENIERDNSEKLRKLDEGWSDAELECLARRRLGLVRPEDKIFYFR